MADIGTVLLLIMFCPKASSPELLSSTSTSTTVARFATETKTENHDFVPEFPDPLECGFINETQRNYEVIQPIVVGGTDTPLGTNEVTVFVIIS